MHSLAWPGNDFSSQLNSALVHTVLNLEVVICFIFHHYLVSIVKTTDDAKEIRGRASIKRLTWFIALSTVTIILLIENTQRFERLDSAWWKRVGTSITCNPLPMRIILALEFVLFCLGTNCTFTRHNTCHCMNAFSIWNHPMTRRLAPHSAPEFRRLLLWPSFPIYNTGNLSHDCYQAGSWIPMHAIT